MFVSGWLCPIIYLLTKGWRGQYWATGRESDKWTVGRSANILMANILISQQFGVRTHLTADVMDQADTRVGMERCHLNTMGTGPAFWPLSYLPFLSRIHNKNWYCFFFFIDVETPDYVQKVQDLSDYQRINRMRTKKHILSKVYLKCCMNYLKFWLFYRKRERENLWIIYWVIFTCTVREETGESSAPKKLNIQKGKCE